MTVHSLSGLTCGGGWERARGFSRPARRSSTSAGEADGRVVLNGLGSKLRRRKRLLLDGRAYPLWQRLKFCMPRAAPADRHALMSRLRRADDGAEYFDMNGRRVYFRPPGRPLLNEQALYRGVTQVLKEAFINDPGFFCPEVQIRPGDVVLDVGGNLGTSAMLFSPLAGPRGRVWSFEPVCCDLLERNIRENRLDNVTPVPLAVGDRCGEVDFAVTDECMDSRIDPGGRGGLRRTLPIVTLDEYCRREGIHRVDFIKMDIEGAEEAALRGGERIIRSLRPRLSIASYHSDGGFGGGEPQHPKLVTLLAGWGYSLREVGRSHIFGW